MAATKTKKNTEGKAGIHAGVLLKPRITEKATRIFESNIYTFDISPRTTKVEVKKAVSTLYGVNPIKVHVVVTKPKSVFSRGKWGTKGGGKKAMVYLKKGDTIEFV